MSYTEKEFNYYLKRPEKINVTLDEDLLISLINVNASLFSYMKPHTLDMVKKAMTINPSIFQYADRTVFTIKYLEEVINMYPMLIQYVYEPNGDLIKIALKKDLNILQYLKKIPKSTQEWILSQNGMMLEYIDAAEQTEALVEIAIRENINAYKYAHVKTLALDLIVLEKDPTRVDMISDFHPELIDYVVNYNPKFITKYFNTPEIITDELKRRAISVDPSVYRLIPDPDLDLMKYAALTDLDLLEYMPYSSDLISYVIKHNGLALKYIVKKDLRTIRKAIEQNVLALDYVEYPREFLIDYAFKKNGLAIKYIENPTVEQYEDAVHRNGYAIEFVPPESQTKSIQLSALSGAGAFAIPYITNPVDDDISLEMIRKEPGYIFKIKKPTDRMFKTAFESTGQLILFYDNWEKRFSVEIIEVALTEDGTILEKVKNKTKAMVLAAINSFPACIKWYENQDLEIAKAAVEKDVRALYYVKQSVMDEDLLALALKLNHDFFTRTDGEMTWEQWQALQS